MVTPSKNTVFTFILIGLVRVSQESCEEFSEGSCPITDFTLIETIHTATAHVCQDKCQLRDDCHYFTWFSSACYLLRKCDWIDHCQCCVSGPGELDSEDVDDCLPCKDPVTLASTTSTTTASSTSTTSPTPSTTMSTTTINSTITTTSSTTTTSATTTTTSTILPEPTPCDEEGWYKINDLSKYCYKIITGFQHIAECNSECINSSGSLTSIHSKTENDFILELMTRHNESLTWLGAVFYNGHFTWLDNTYVNYLHWAEGQPDMHEWGNCIGLGAHLAAEQGGRPGAWDDVDCRDYLQTSCTCKRPA